MEKGTVIPRKREFTRDLIRDLKFLDARLHGHKEQTTIRLRRTHEINSALGNSSRGRDVDRIQPPLYNQSRIMKSFKVKVSDGGFAIHGFVQKMGKDLLISIWGGTRPHIGAVAIATPRPSLKNPEKASATSSNFTFLGHKEDLLAKDISEKIASQAQCHVVVAAGLHWDHLTSKDIRYVETLIFQMAI